MTTEETLIQQWTADPEGRALVQAILDRKGEHPAVREYDPRACEPLEGPR